ncbi:MAG: hypothetical protein WCG75_11810 [Armatimonadota bacterium]
MKLRKRKNWLAWTLGILSFLAATGAVVGKSVLNDLATKIGSNKFMITNAVKDRLNGANIDQLIIESARPSVLETIDGGSKQMGKLVAIETADTIPNVSDVLNHGQELSYNLPVQFENGYKTYTIRVRNDGSNPKIVGAFWVDGITERQSFKRELKKHLQ